MQKRSAPPAGLITTMPLRWKSAAVAVTLIVWSTILVTGLQTWWGREAAEMGAYDHLLDTSHQLEQAVQRFLAESRTLARVILFELSPERQHASTATCPLICSDVLVEIQRRWSELFPGVEILVMNPEGHVVAATEADMRDRLRDLSELAAHFRDHPDAVAMVRYAKNSRNEHALLVSRAQRSPAGEVQAIVAILQRASLLSEFLAVPQLGPGRAVTIADNAGTLVARDPPPLLMHFGHRLTQFFEESQPGLGVGSFHAVSKIDRVNRLWIKREIPFAWAPGNMVLSMGKSVDDYLTSWRRSTLLNVFVGIALLIGWSWTLYVFRQHERSRSQLRATADLSHKLMESTPVPVVLISQAEGTVLMSNGAMLHLFGALATVGQPMWRIFGDNTLLERLRDGSMNRSEIELVSRKGAIHAELHGTDLGDLGGTLGHCWLMVLVDVSERFKREQHLHQEATTDALTGLVNRRHFMFLAEEAIARAREMGTPLSVLALDLDHFKRVNDEHGHDVGDLVLTTVAKVFNGVLRELDVAARIGGEEFVALLPRADRTQAEMVAERVRRAIASTPILLPNSKVLTMTASIGVSSWHENDADVQAALKRADKALYVAKRSGRNRVENDDSEESATA